MGERRRIAVVSGASHGIGKEVARRLVQAGLDVVVGGRDEEAAREAAREIGARAARLDVTDRRSVGALAEELPKVDVLVHNVGSAMNGVRGARHAIELNVLGPMHLTDSLLPKMPEGGRIVMVSSRAGELARFGARVRRCFENPELTRDELVTFMDSFVLDVESGAHEQRGWPSSADDISKAALNALTRVFARELAEDPRGICVNAACPCRMTPTKGGSAAENPADGADTAVWLALEASSDLKGLFFRERTSVPF